MSIESVTVNNDGSVGLFDPFESSDPVGSDDETNSVEPVCLKLMYITNSLPVAMIAEKYGVDRIWIDLETIGKGERQKGQDSVKSHHSIEDIQMIKPHLTSSEILVRVNKGGSYSAEEIDAVIEAGADMVMLPYWKEKKEVRGFLDAVDGRCKTTLLLETKEAADIIDEILEMGGFDEIHIGLNDLHLSYGKTFMFELLTDGTVERLCEKFKKAGIPFGFGGIAKIGDGAVPAEMIIMEHYRLGSTRAILSRTFCDNAKIDGLDEVDRIFRENMKKLRDFEKIVAAASDREKKENRRNLEAAVNKVVGEIKKMNIR